MKTIVSTLLVLVTLMFAVHAPAATPAQFDAWKAQFPAPSAIDPVNLQQKKAGYQLLVNKVTPVTARKLLLALKDKLVRDQAMTNSVLHPQKPNPKVTPAMQTEAAEFSSWLNGKFSPFLAAAPQ